MTKSTVGCNVLDLQALFQCAQLFHRRLLLFQRPSADNGDILLIPPCSSLFVLYRELSIVVLVQYLGHLQFPFWWRCRGCSSYHRVPGSAMAVPLRKAISMTPSRRLLSCAGSSLQGNIPTPHGKPALPSGMIRPPTAPSPMPLKPRGVEVQQANVGPPPDSRPHSQRIAKEAQGGRSAGASRRLQSSAWQSIAEGTLKKTWLTAHQMTTTKKVILVSGQQVLEPK